MKQRLNDDNGAALIELALVMPIFLLVMFGAVELGRAAHYTIEVENAARAGASYGGENMGNATASSMVIQAAQNDAPDLPSLLVTPGAGCVCETLNLTTGTPTFSPSSGTVSCSDATITSCTGTSSSITQSVVSYVTVRTSATIAPAFNVSGLPTSYTLHGYSAMRILPN
jgi:Flp pilus assembly protein TadG